MATGSIQAHVNTASGDGGATTRWGGLPLARLVAVALLLVALGVAIGSVASRALAPRPPGTGSAEVTFAQRMAMHHAQAVAMSTIIYDRSANAELRTLALDVMLTQQSQIGQMQGWLTLWGQPLTPPVSATSMTGMAGMSGSAGMAGMPGMATQAEVDALRTAPVSAAETSYLRLMIRHHQGGVTMAREVLNQTSRPEVVRMARSIIASQQSEITYMQRLLDQRTGAAGR